MKWFTIWLRKLIRKPRRPRNYYYIHEGLAASEAREMGRVRSRYPVVLG